MVGDFLQGASRFVLSMRLPQGSCRFSLRHVVSGDRWAPERQQIVRSGDQVILYCHSLGIGPFANITRPPEKASPLMYIGADKHIVLPVPRLTDHRDNDKIISSYDNGTMSAADQEAYERIGVFLTDSVEMSSHDLVAKGIITPEDAQENRWKIGKVTVNSKTALQDPSRYKDAMMGQLQSDVVHEARHRCSAVFRKMILSMGPEYSAVADNKDLMTAKVATFTVVFE